VEVIVERVAGLDVHKETVMAAVRAPGEKGRVQKVKEFRTFNADLVALRRWLIDEGVTLVVMEATGVYWRAPWHVLEDHAGWELMLVNARHVKNLPGRKTACPRRRGWRSWPSAGCCGAVSSPRRLSASFGT
jgi:transposase